MLKSQPASFIERLVHRCKRHAHGLRFAHIVKTGYRHADRALEFRAVAKLPSRQTPCGHWTPRWPENEGRAHPSKSVLRRDRFLESNYLPQQYGHQKECRVLPIPAYKPRNAGLLPVVLAYHE